MPVSLGSRIGPYEILAPLGAGGMGEVYRARDAKLNRDVAIKVLPELFTVDPDRLTRFRREAQVLASLNHANIGHIYGLEDASGVHALVLELVEGPTLAERIAERAVPLEEALPIARQMADALECAHEQGIIHRDLKPANIKVRSDGTVKVLDFGLAKAFDPAASSGSEVMNSPTLTARATQLGLIVGTAAYMAPEQARGRAVDRRADIWAFGVVLFEMLTGKRAFEGDDISITLASVLKDDVDWKALPADLPPSVMRVLRRCLEKDPKRRLSAIGDARLELDDAAISATAAVAAPPVTAPAVPGWRRLLPWGIASAGVLAALIAWSPWHRAAPPPPLRLNTVLVPDGTLTVGIAPAAALSRDGQTVVFVAAVGKNRSQLHVRRLSQLQSTALAGTDDAFAPFFSPDGQWIGFFAGGALKKIAVTGGAAMTLCPAQNGRGGWWGEDGTIVFQPVSAPGATLHRVSEAGGTSVPIGVQAENETTQRWPQILPGGRGVLYSGNLSTVAWDTGTLMVQPPDGSAPRLVLRGGFFGRYVPSGHLLYIQGSTLFAVPFDIDRLAIAGNPAPVVEGVIASNNTGGAQFSVAGSGTLIYVPGQNVGREAPVHLMDANGQSMALRAERADWYHPQFSPDGRKLAMTIGAAGSHSDIWVHEAERDLTKLTFERGPDLAPVWTPDGARIAYASGQPETAPPNLFWQRANGTGSVQRLAESKNVQMPFSFHPSGKYLAYTERSTAGNADVMILPLEGDEKTGWKPGRPTAFLATPHNETAPMFSPDGRWLAYMSSETAAFEIYVRPFPSGDGKWKISNTGGIFPRWSRARPELFYLVIGPLNQVMVASYRVEGDSFVSGAPKQWSPQLIAAHGTDLPYDVHPDGQRIVMSKPPEQPAEQRDKAVFVFNFFDELRRAAPRK